MSFGRARRLAGLALISVAAAGMPARADDEPAGWTRCAAEHEMCTFTGARRVTYGASLTSRNVVRTFDGGVVCNNQSFGDPARGVVKSCWVEDGTSSQSPEASQAQPAVAPEPAAPSEFAAEPPPVVPPPPSSPLPLSPAMDGQVTARLQATRLTGVAPLAVQFDATESSALNVDLPFHQLIYDFDFGDDRGLTWAISGRPKNTQSGAPLAAHVFDNPGQYTVRVRASNPQTGLYSEATVVIDVKDANAEFAGNRTVCVSIAGKFDGCPDGAARAKAVPEKYANKRVLLRRGEKYPAINLSPIDDNVLIAAFGEGPKPITQRVYLSGNGNFAGWPDDVTVMDLNIINGFDLHVTGSRILLYRCDMTEPNREKINIGTAVPYYLQTGRLRPDQYHWPREVFLVENTAIGETSEKGLPGIVVMGHFMKSAMLGNTFNRANEHTVRVWAGYKTVLAHNAIGGDHFASAPPGIRHALKFQSSGVNPYDDNMGKSGTAIATRYIVTADNRFGSPTYPGSWIATFAPENSDTGTVQGIEDVIMERDIFIRGPHTSQDIHNVVRRGTVRDQTVAGGEPLRIHQVSPFEWNGNPAMKAWCGPYFGMPNNL